MKKNLTFLLILLLPLLLRSQTDSVVNPKKGWTFGAVPVVAFDTDIGFKYGGLVNLYDYGDGKSYPKYHHSIYLEWSRTTKGSGINNILYDTEYLIPGLRTTLDINYLTEKALNFYGFNGYNANYNSALEDDSSPNYISRVYYRHERKMFRTVLDFQGKIIGKKLRWLAGAGFYNTKIATVDINKLNKGKSDSDKLPDTTLLYDNYVKWGIITPDQKDGGNVTLLKLGLVYDTRDNEPNPMHGMWTEVFLLNAPSFLGNDYKYTQFVFSHRQYFTLAPKILNLALRGCYEGKIGGEMPFFMLPWYYNTVQTRDGFGGAKTIRGVLRDRIQGDGVAFCNAELRWKFFRKIIGKQNFYIALNTFADGGRVTQPFSFPDPQGRVPKAKDESWHIGYGAGLHFALNENFIVAFDYGLAANPQDGKSGLYINLNFLY
jgi:outer membrane protein assembly factor BamA